MLAGQIGVVTHSTGFMGKAIEWLTRSDSHHVVIAVSGTVCVSAEPDGVRYRNIAEYEHVVWSQYGLTDEQRTAIIWHATSSLGTPYNVPAFIALGIHFTTGARIPDRAATWLNNQGRVTCSQLAADIMVAVGSLPVPTTTIVCPADWQHMFEQVGWWDGKSQTYLRQDRMPTRSER